MSKLSDKKIDVSEKKKVLEEYEKRIECEKKAHRFVEDLVERGTNVEEKDFTLSLKWITKEHYRDIVEERSIIGICGYCLCRNELKEVSKAQYKIIKNKVYDITERKKFCSEKCFSQSEYAMNQISSIPLWLRDPSKIPDIKLKTDLHKTDILRGEEVPLRQMISAKEIHVLENENPEIGSSTEKTIPHGSHNNKVGALLPENTVTKVSFEGEIDAILNTVIGWFTIQTFQYLGYGSKANDEESLKRDNEGIQHKKLTLEKELDGLILGSQSTSGAATKPFPDVARISVDPDLYQERVNEFYTGNLTILEKNMKKKGGDNQENNEEPLLPSVDSKNQMRIRQKIVQDNISKTVHNLQLPIGRQTTVVMEECRKLISTFQFCSKNVMFGTEKWRIVAIVLLLLISIPDPDRQELLKLKNVRLQLDMFLKLYGLDVPSLQNKLLSCIHFQET